MAVFSIIETRTVDLYQNLTSLIPYPYQTPFVAKALDVSQPLLPSDVFAYATEVVPPFAITTSLILLWTYFSTWASYANRAVMKKPLQMPPIIPYTLPFIGSALHFALNPAACLASARKMLGSPTAYGLRILSHNLYFMHGPENIAVLWKKYSTGFTTTDLPCFVLQSVFKMPKKALKVYRQDKSGIAHKPATNISPHNRIEYLSFQNFHKCLNGERLGLMFGRWSSLFADEVPSLNIQSEWKSVPDIVDFFLYPSTAALNRALTGPLLDCINPTFQQDFIDFIPHCTAMMTGLPKWCMPKAYALQNKLVSNVKQWHAIARARFQESDVDSEGFDPWFGSQLMRERQNFLPNIDDWDADAVASADIALLWGYVPACFEVDDIG